MRQVWIDGALADEATARVSPFDHGLLTGDGVFETIRAYRGRPFALRRHLDRLNRSAEGLGLAGPDAALLHRVAPVGFQIRQQDVVAGHGRVHVAVDGVDGHCYPRAAHHTPVRISAKPTT